MNTPKILKTMIPLLLLVLSFTAVRAQFIPAATFEPAQPCTTDSICLIYWDSITTPIGGGTQVNWYYSDNSGNSFSLRGDTVKVLFDSAGTYDVWYDVVFQQQGQTWVDSGVLTIFVDSICADNAISGTVYDDANGNGVQDGGETGLPGAPITLSPSGYTTFSGTNGGYTIMTRPGTYTVGVDVPLYWQLTQPASPGTYTATFTGSGGSSAGNDFGLNAATNVQDLTVSLNGWVARPGFSTTYWVNYCNVGTTTQSGTVTVSLDSRLTLDASNPVPDATSGTTFTYNYTNLLPGECRQVQLTMDAPAPPALEIGDVLNGSATIDPMVSDTTPGDNTDSLSQTVVGSYDPNDKTAFAGSALAEGISILPVKTLTYLIRFQNTGTFLAENVRIEDTLVNLLDFSSINILDASHAYNYSVDPTTKAIVWYFDNIMLPDSNANEPASHGFVTFEVDVVDWENVNNGTAINNTAYIYFDFNPAVITNTSVTTFDRTSSIRDITNLQLPSTVYPNPMEGSATISFDNNGESYNIRVIDILGKTVMDVLNVTTDRVELNAGDFERGVYLYDIYTGTGNLSSGKFIVR